MKKKTYRTYFLKSLDLHLNAGDGLRMEVVFRGGVRIDSTAKYTTTDPKVQQALEGSSGFGRDFYLESETDLNEAPEEKVVASSPEPKKELVTIKDARRFHNLVEMKNAMEEVGISVEPSWNYAKCVSVSSKAGYDFQIQR